MSSIFSFSAQPPDSTTTTTVPQNCRDACRQREYIGGECAQVCIPENNIGSGFDCPEGWICCCQNEPTTTSPTLINPIQGY